MKPWYPKELSCREDIASLVDRRWREYFPSGEGRDGRFGARSSGLRDTRFSRSQ